MDPVSFLFSSYLNAVHTATYDHLTESMGTQLQAVVIEYDGVKVPFQYQMWMVRDASVCQRYRNHVGDYSTCTQTASRLFNDLCHQLSQPPSGDWRKGKLRNMYCNAAVSYKPTIANIAAAADHSDLQQARQRCNAATVAAMGSSDFELRQQRDQLCKHYQDLRDQPVPATQ